MPYRPIEGFVDCDRCAGRGWLVTQMCDACEGFGVRPPDEVPPRTCTVCGGARRITTTEPDESGRGWVVCYGCEGKGYC